MRFDAQFALERSIGRPWLRCGIPFLSTLVDDERRRSQPRPSNRYRGGKAAVSVSKLVASSLKLTDVRMERIHLEWSKDRHRTKRNSNRLPVYEISRGEIHQLVSSRGKLVLRHGETDEHILTEEGWLERWRIRWTRWKKRGKDVLWTALFPNNVTDDYWSYSYWRTMQRVSGGMLSVYSTQSLLQAVGVGSRKALPASAALNWVLKDGLGKLGKLGVGSCLGSYFDANLKQAKFASSVLYMACVGLEIMTHRFPRYFLLLAGAANAGKGVGLATSLAVQPAFNKSFALEDNMASISAKGQVQTTLADMIGIAGAMGISSIARRLSPKSHILPYAAFPILSFLDLFCIHSSMKSIHLRSVNLERGGLLADHWVSQRRVLKFSEVSALEPIWASPKIGRRYLPLRVASVRDAISDPDDLLELIQMARKKKYLLILRHGHIKKSELVLVLKDGAEFPDIIEGLLQAAHLRRLIKPQRQYFQRSELHRLQFSKLFQESLQRSESDVKDLLEALQVEGWHTSQVLMGDIGQTRLVWNNMC